MAVDSLSAQCIRSVMKNITTDDMKLPTIPGEICQKLVEHMFHDRKMRRQPQKYLDTYWSVVLHKLLSACNELHILDLSNSTLSDETISIIGKHCPHLHSLDLTGNKLLSGSSISNLVCSLRGLKALNLANCAEVNDACILGIAKSGVDLHSISLVQCHNIIPKTLQALIGALPNLQKINLAKCSTVTDNCISLLADTCSQLIYLNIKLCQRLSDKSISKVVSQLVHLEALVMEDCARVSDNAFVDFRCTALRKLNLDFCCRVTPKALLAIVQVATRLDNVSVQYLDAANAKDEFVAFIGRCKHVFKLNIFNSPDFLDVRIVEKLGELSELKVLSMGSNIAGVMDASFGLQIPEAMQRLFEKLPYLERFSLGRVRVNKKVISLLAKHCPIREFSLRWCGSTEGDALMDVAKNMPNLEIFTAAEESPCLINDNVVQKIIENCDNMEELKLITCTGITDAGLTDLPRLKKLRKLVLSGSSISDKSIPAIAACKSLVDLDISHCRLLTRESINLLTKKTETPFKLMRLSLDGFLWMVEEHVVKLVDAFPLLSNLYISDCRLTGKSILIEDMDLAIHTVSTTLSRTLVHVRKSM